MNEIIRHAEPLDKAHLPRRFSSKLAGVSFAPNYPAILHKLAARPELRLVLVREPDNPHDENAVAVRVENGTKVLGHLPAGLAARVAPELDAGATWRVTTWEVLVQEGYEDRPGLSVTMERDEP